MVAWIELPAKAKKTWFSSLAPAAKRSAAYPTVFRVVGLLRLVALLVDARKPSKSIECGTLKRGVRFCSVLWIWGSFPWVFGFCRKDMIWIDLTAKSFES